MREENRSEIIHDALNLLDDEMIEEVEKLRGQVAVKNTKFPWRKWSALAAGICLVLSTSWIWNSQLSQEGYLSDKEELKDEIGNNPAVEIPEDMEESNQNDEMDNKQEAIYEYQISGTPEAESSSGIEIPAMVVDLRRDEEVARDMLAFFIHEGRCYVQTEYIKEGAAFVGDYVGTSIGLIDEWTTEDGYVDGAGSVGGDFYEVEGVSTDFMLCVKYENGAVEIFVNNSGLKLSKGSELMVDRLNLKGNYESVAFLSNTEWNETHKEPIVLSEEYNQVFDALIDSFSEGQFIYTDNIPYDGEGISSIYTNENVYHLYFETESGIRLHFWLFDGGYVAYSGISQGSVKIDQEIYEEIIEILEKESYRGGE